LEFVAYIARQPILDARGVVRGYELLYRDAHADRARFQCGDRATASVLASMLGTMDLDTLTDGRPAYVNFTDRMLAGGFSTMLPPDQVVLELLEGTELTRDLAKSCRELHRLGYRLALDDYTVDSPNEPLLALVNIVKIDLQAMGGKLPASWAASLRERGLTLLAEKVETWEQFQACREAGCTLFQGYFFAHPEVFSTRDLHPSQIALIDALRLLAGEAELADIEAALSHDTGLIYKFLRYANAAAFARVREIDTLHDAFVLLGRNRLKVWLILLLYATADDHPASHALLDTARQRSALMGVCARELGLDRKECSEAQVVGSFSLLEALLQRPIAELVDRLALPARMAAALLDREGVFGRLLRLVERLEGPWCPELAAAAADVGIGRQRLGALQLEAMSEAATVFRG